jgi:peptide/nickel transport system permease protein
MKKGKDKSAHKYESFFDIFIYRFKNNKLGMFSLFVIIALIFMGLFAPFLANDAPVMMVHNGKVTFPGLFDYPEFRAVNWKNKDFTPDFVIWPLHRQSPVKTNLRNRLQTPSWQHPCGTDDNGIDVLARIIWGTRISISIGIVSAVITLLIGTIIGAVAGFFGGWVDAVISRIIEVMMCFPTFFLILAVIAFLPPNIYTIMVVIGLTTWTGIARLVRGEVFKVKSLDYVKSAKINGLTNTKIIFKHILPNSITPALISATFNVSGAILVESSLSFLGFGVQPPTPSWGAIIEVAKRYVMSEIGNWLALFPAIAIFITVTAYNLLGQSIRDAADPKMIE